MPGSFQQDFRADYKIEDIWDQKNFLDRNQNDGSEKRQHDQLVNERPIQTVISKSELPVKLQQNREKRSKLKSKMANPKASMTLKSKWEIESVQVEAIIEETEIKRAIL